MNTRRVKSFIRVDISDATQKCLIKKQGFDWPFAFLQTEKEGGELELQRVWAHTSDMCRRLLIELYSAKLSNIVVDEDTVFQLENRA